MINRKPQFADLRNGVNNDGMTNKPDNPEEVVISENFRLQFLDAMRRMPDERRPYLVQVSSRIPDFDGLMERVERQSDYLSDLLGVKLVDEEVNSRPEPHLKVQMTRANAEALFVRLNRESLTGVFDEGRLDLAQPLEDPYEEFVIRKLPRRRPVQMDIWDSHLQRKLAS